MSKVGGDERVVIHHEIASLIANATWCGIIGIHEHNSDGMCGQETSS